MLRVDLVGDEGSERSAGETSSKVAISVIMVGMVVVEDGEVRGA